MADEKDKRPKTEEEVEAKVVAVRPETEALPNYGIEVDDIDYIKMLQKYKERSLFVDGVRKDALTKTRPHQWLARRDSKGNTTLNLMAPGAERIRANCPIGYLNKRDYVEQWNKDTGPGYTIYYEADFFLGSPKSGTMPVIGSCSSDDDFFSIEHNDMPYSAENPEHKAALENGDGKLSGDGKTIYMKVRIPATEVSKEDIRKSALSNLVVNGVTRVLGIRSVSPDELQEIGIDITKIPSIDYGSKKAQSGRLAPAQEQKKSELWKMLVELCGGDEAKAKADLKVRTAFKARDGGRDYDGQDNWERLSEKQIEHHYERIKADFTAWKEGEGQSKKTPDKKGGAAPGGQREIL